MPDCVHGCLTVPSIFTFLKIQFVAFIFFIVTVPPLVHSIAWLASHPEPSLPKYVLPPPILMSEVFSAAITPSIVSPLVVSPMVTSPLIFMEAVEVLLNYKIYFVKLPYFFNNTYHSKFTVFFIYFTEVL